MFLVTSQREDEYRWCPYCRTMVPLLCMDQHLRACMQHAEDQATWRTQWLNDDEAACGAWSFGDGLIGTKALC